MLSENKCKALSLAVVLCLSTTVCLAANPQAKPSGTATDAPQTTTNAVPSSTATPATQQEVAPTKAAPEAQEIPAPAPPVDNNKLDSPAASEMTSEQQTQYRQAKAFTHYDLAQVYFHNWNLNLADVEYEVSLLYSPDMKAARRDLCLVSLFRGHPLKALAELMVMIGLAEPVPLNEAEIAKLYTQAGKRHYEQALVFGRDNNWINAIAECQWAIIYQPNNATYRHSLAFAFANQGQFDNAEREYTSAFALDPSDGFARADFAFMLDNSGSKGRAINELSKAVQLEPSAAALHVDLGWMAEAKGNLPLAEEEFQKAVDLSPAHAALWIHLGRILETQNKTADAIAAYTKAISIDPSLSDIKNKLAKLKT